MPESMFTIARNEHECPRCGAKKQEYCHTPKNKRCKTPHTERVLLIPKEEQKRCVGKGVSIDDILNKKVV